MNVKDWWNYANIAWGNSTIVNNDTDTEVYTEWINNCELVISFRATEMNIKDWFYNMFFFHKDIPYDDKDDIECHRGFLLKYMSAKDDIHELVSSAAKVYITGISQGAAIGLLCAMDIHETFNIIPEVKVFCAPKVFNYLGAEYFSFILPEASIMLSRNDIVPKVPPFFLDFYQPKKNIKYIDEFRWSSLINPFQFHHPSYYEKMLFP